MTHRPIPENNLADVRLPNYWVILTYPEIIPDRSRARSPYRKRSIGPITSKSQTAPNPATPNTNRNDAIPKNQTPEIIRDIPAITQISFLP
jgi:hypothetical protein